MNRVLAEVETFRQVTHKVSPSLKGGGKVYRKGEVALSRIFRKLQEGREARGKGREGREEREGSVEVCPLNWELLAVIKPYNPRRKMYTQKLVKKAVPGCASLLFFCAFRKRKKKKGGKKIMS